MGPTQKQEKANHLHWLTLALLGAWPFLSFLDHNQDDALIYGSATLGYGAAFVGLLFALALLGRLVFGRERSRQVTVTLGVGAVCLFSYLTVAGPLSRLGIALGSIKIAIWLVGSLAIMAVALRLSAWRNTTLVLTVVAGAMVAVPAARLSLFAVEAGGSNAAQSATAVAPVVVEGGQPNVYWIVLDGYTRADALGAYFGDDNDGFLDELRARRFFVADAAFANYASTKLSLSTTGNMDYFLPVNEPMHPAMWTSRLQGFNRVVDRFLAKGYRYVHVEPGGNNLKTRCGGREAFCLTSGSSGVLGLNEAEVGLLKLTPVFPIVRRLLPDFLSFDFTHLADVSGKLAPASGEPLFAFVHILSPHPPPRYNADCSRIDRVAFDLVGDEGASTPETYLADLKCLNPEVVEFVDQLLANDPSDPLIIIQSDHGYRGDENELPTPAIEAIDRRLVRFAVLQAMRLPERCGGLLRHNITLVNTFPLVFTCMGDTDVQQVADQLFRHSKTTTWPMEIDQMKIPAAKQGGDS